MKTVFVVAGILVGVILIIIAIGYSLPVSHVSTRSKNFKSNPLQIWQTIIDFKNYPSWRKSVKSIEAIGQDSWNESDNHGNKVQYKLEIIEVGNAWKTTIVSKGIPFGGYWIFKMDKTDDITQLTITENGEVYNPFFRFVSKFVMGHTATIDAYLDDLKSKLGE